MICAICSKEILKGELSTIRQKWLDAGGWGTPPVEAIVHVKCDKKERQAKGQRAR